MHTVETDQCPDHSDGRHRYGPFGECMGTTCKAQSILHPCRSPYCECEPGKCTHPGFRDARHETAEITDEESRLRAIFEATAKDSFNFRRSRRGTYVNPAIARDWKWFYLGATKGNALTQRPAAQTEREADGLPLIVAGAIFDFAGFMTTRSEVIEVGSTAEAGPVADLVKEWAELRGLNLADAAVLSWQLHINRASLPAPQQATPERHLTVTTNQQGEAVMVSWQDDEHRILDVVWERKQATPEPVGEPVGTVVHTKLNGQAKPWVTVALNQDADLPDGAKLFTHPAPGVPEGFALVPMTEDQVWHNDSIMSANAIGGLKMDAVMRIVRGVEAHHSERLTVRMNGG